MTNSITDGRMQKKLGFLATILTYSSSMLILENTAGESKQFHKTIGTCTYYG